jgi:hypothetical protein
MSQWHLTVYFSFRLSKNTSTINHFTNENTKVGGTLRNVGARWRVIVGSRSYSRNSCLANIILMKQRTLFCFCFATKEKQVQRFLSTKFGNAGCQFSTDSLRFFLLKLMLANKIFRAEWQTVVSASLRVQQFTTPDPVLFIFISRMVPINFLNRVFSFFCK